MSHKITIDEDQLKAALDKHMLAMLENKKLMDKYWGVLYPLIFADVVPIAISKALKELRP